MDEDWQRLNAYADGELDPADHARLEAALRARPELRADLERIRELKSSLAALRVRETPIGADAPSPRPRRRRGIAAAVVLLLCGLAAGLFWQMRAPLPVAQALAMHDRLSQAGYTIRPRSVVPVVAGGPGLELRAPDLTASRLHLVAIVESLWDGLHGVGMHYRGWRGCRLTIIAVDDPGALVQPVRTSKRMVSWSAGGISFAVIADGMDAARFASIADFARASIRDNRRDSARFRVAMADRYRSARSCT